MFPLILLTLLPTSLRVKAAEKATLKAEKEAQLAELTAAIATLAVESSGLEAEIAAKVAAHQVLENKRNWLNNKALFNAHGKFATACPDGALHWDTEKLQAWERFQVS